MLGRGQTTAAGYTQLRSDVRAGPSKQAAEFRSKRHLRRGRSERLRRPLVRESRTVVRFRLAAFSTIHSRREESRTFGGAAAASAAKRLSDLNEVRDGGSTTCDMRPQVVSELCASRISPIMLSASCPGPYVIGLSPPRRVSSALGWRGKAEAATRSERARARGMAGRVHCFKPCRWLVKRSLVR